MYLKPTLLYTKNLSISPLTYSRLLIATDYFHCSTATLSFLLKLRPVLWTRFISMSSYINFYVNRFVCISVQSDTYSQLLSATHKRILNLNLSLHLIAFQLTSLIGNDRFPTHFHLGEKCQLSCGTAYPDVRNVGRKRWQRPFVISGIFVIVMLCGTGEWKATTKLNLAVPM